MMDEIIEMTRMYSEEQEEFVWYVLIERDTSFQRELELRRELREYISSPLFLIKH